MQLPREASAKLPSRGQVVVEGTVNGFHVHAPLEPDGKLSHWVEFDSALQKGAKAVAGDTVSVSIEPSKAWPEPEVPADLREAVAADRQARELWAKITPMARWEWVRWTRATASSETRKRRIEVGISKMKSGERRPCCWNRNLCTEPSVSKSGILLDPSGS